MGQARLSGTRTAAVSRALALAFVASLFTCSSVGERDTVDVKLAAINDFHGYVEASHEPVFTAAPGESAPPVRAGGLARLASLVEGLRARNRNFAFVSAGDLIGASPLLSAAFDDELTIEAMNAAGLDFNGLGNHEFDAGVGHLRRMQAGGCPATGCKSGGEFKGARFGFLAANVIVRQSGKPLFAPYGVRDYGGVAVAFVGVTLRGTPGISNPKNVAGLEFRDEAEAVNALVPELKAKGIEAIVVLIHQGGFARGGPNACVDLRGAIGDIVARLDPAVDVVVSGHTHQAYVCELSGRLVTSAGSYGRFVTEIDLHIDRRTRDVVASRAVNRVVSQDIPEHRGVAEIGARYTQLAAPLQRVVGRIAAPLPRSVNRDGESRLGQMIADAHLAATRRAGAQLAFVNPGGIRAPLPSAGEVTYAQVFDVYPFNNILVTMTLSGAELVQLLEQQWQPAFARILQVSSGFSYAWDPAAPPGSRVVRDSVTIDGRRVQPDGAYRVTVNSYLAGGGDAFGIFEGGRERTIGVSSREAIVRYLQTDTPPQYGAERRIRRVDG